MSTETRGSVRINKCFGSFASRREADAFVSEGRVTVNGKVAVPGSRVYPADVVRLDDKVVDWERLALAESATSTFHYIKYWKPFGVVCTTETSEPANIIRALDAPFSDRIFPVGRLDMNSTGLIFLTSDGRVPEAVLGASRDCTKQYLVKPDRYVSDRHLHQLRNGVVIKTVAQRDNTRRALVAPTLPCRVDRVGDGVHLRFFLNEGRNRQIRRMLGVLGYTTRAIHRERFMDISLEGLEKPGDWAHLQDWEVSLLCAGIKSVNLV